MFAFNLDREQAIAGSGAGYQGITTSGAFGGRFTQVIVHEWPSKAAGLHFYFESDGGAETDFHINCKKTDGQPNQVGINQVQSIMAVLRVKALNAVPTQMKMMNWDVTPAREEMRPVQAYPDLCHKPIGLVMQAEEYLKSAGKNAGLPGTRMNYYACFEAASRKTAQELYAETEAQAIDAMLAHLTDIKLSNYPAQAQASLPGSNGFSQPATTGGTGGGSTDFDDDIPFGPIRGVV